MCVGGDWLVGVPTSLCVCVCVCVCVCASACVFVPMPYKKSCIDAVYFVCRAHYGGGRGDNGTAHKQVVTLNE